MAKYIALHFRPNETKFYGSKNGGNNIQIDVKACKKRGGIVLDLKGSDTNKQNIFSQNKQRHNHIAFIEYSSQKKHFQLDKRFDMKPARLRGILVLSLCEYD